jgi:hypothetical protein
MKSSEPPKNFKYQPHPFVRPSFVHFCQNFFNLSHETILLNKDLPGAVMRGLFAGVFILVEAVLEDGGQPWQATLGSAAGELK